MRKLLLILSVLLLGACWAVAQDTTNPNSSQSSPTSASSGQSSTTANGAITVEGCLSGSSGNYTLSAKDGTSYTLTGNTAKLSEHVGHEVKITGTPSAASNGGGTATDTAGQASGSSQTLEVSSVKHISKTCQNGSMSK